MFDNLIPDLWWNIAVKHRAVLDFWVGLFPLGPHCACEVAISHLAARPSTELTGSKLSTRSLVIDHLHTAYMNEGTAVIYAYCYYKERSQQSLPNILGGLLKQLLSLRSTVSADVKASYQACQDHPVNRTLAEISGLLRAELGRYRKVFIIIDALDEYSENQNDCDSLLAEVEQLRGYSNMMLTSRFVAPYVDAFCGASRVTITAEDRDVRKYLESQIPTLPKFVKANRDLQELIIQTITKAVEGMYVPSILFSMPCCNEQIEVDNPTYCNIYVARCKAE